MSHHQPLRAWRAFRQWPGARWAAAGALACLNTACGGGGDAMHVRPQGSVDAAARAHTVQIAGCVVDQFFVPNEGVPVRVLSADGRLLASARSGRAGEFRVQVPATSSMELQVDADNSDVIPLQTQARDQVVDACLLARAR